jgi:Putative beta-lactamase-inhibitor-like, PepSY-like
MKKIIILVAAISMISVSASSQKNLPENVKKEFNKKYAAAQSVKWDNEEKNEWEANFISDGIKMSASFDNSGKWLESETKIMEKDLPSSVANTIIKEFPEYKKGNIEKFENPETKGFELELKKDKTSIEVILDNRGKIIKKTGMKKEDEKAEKVKK